MIQAERAKRARLEGYRGLDPVVCPLLAGLLYDFLGLGRQHPKASRQCVNPTLDCCMTSYER